jgi:hypothetical protein
MSLVSSMTIVVFAAGPELPGGNRTAALVFAIVAACGAAAPWFVNAISLRRSRMRHLKGRELAQAAHQDDGGTPDHVLSNLRELRQIDFSYIVESRSMRNRGAAIASVVAGLLVLTGLGLAVGGALASGIAIALMGSVPGAVSKMYYSRAQEADHEVRTIRREIERILLIETMQPGPTREALIADVVRGSAGLTPTTTNIRVDASPRQIPAADAGSLE